MKWAVLKSTGTAHAVTGRGMLSCGGYFRVRCGLLLRLYKEVEEEEVPKESKRWCKSCQAILKKETHVRTTKR